MSIIQGNAKQASTRGFYNFPIEQSLRFNDDDGAYLSWTPDSAGNRKTFTWSGWVKRGNIGIQSFVFSTGADSSNRFQVGFETNDVINIEVKSGGSTQVRLVTTQVFRDPSAWYHIVVEVDTTQASSGDRVNLYINGEEVTTFSTETYPSQNADLEINKAIEHNIGKRTYSSNYSDGYFAEINFIDGTALDADSFGELKNGVWIPKDPSGLTYGTNGFRLSFADDAEVEAFNTVLYRGNGSSSRSITGMGFQPDLVFYKSRSSSGAPAIYDAVRGAGSGKMLSTNQASAEGIDDPYTDTDYGYVSSFDSDGFSVANGSVNGVWVNTSGTTYVAWGWKAGDSNVSNTDGSITSTVRANTDYGFSIVSWIGNESTATVGHGLGATPDFILVKNRDDSGPYWRVYHSELGAQNYLALNATDASASASTVFPTAPTSSVFGVGADNAHNGSGDDIIAYCWAEKAGYSKFGSYTGTGSDGSPTITTGFKPAWVMLKRTDSTGDWNIFDNTRSANGEADNVLYANLSNSEYSGTNDGITVNDTGFTLSNTYGAMNASGGTYIYAAFADTREAAFWLDQSGNDNDWQPVNLDHNDTVADSPTDNFATLNPLSADTITLSDGNLRGFGGSGGSGNVFAESTIGMSSGQFYCEVTYVAAGTSNALNIGVKEVQTNSFTPDYGYYAFNGNKYEDSTPSAYGDSYGVGDVIGIALDMDAGKVWFAKNGVWQNSGDPVAGTGEAFSGLSGTFTFCQVRFGGDSHTTEWNFGQQPFKYDPPA